MENGSTSDHALPVVDTFQLKLSAPKTGMKVFCLFVSLKLPLLFSLSSLFMGCFSRHPDVLWAEKTRKL